MSPEGEKPWYENRQKTGFGAVFSFLKPLLYGWGEGDGEVETDQESSDSDREDVPKNPLENDKIWLKLKAKVDKEPNNEFARIALEEYEMDHS